MTVPGNSPKSVFQIRVLLGTPNIKELIMIKKLIYLLLFLFSIISIFLGIYGILLGNHHIIWSIFIFIIGISILFFFLIQHSNTVKTKTILCIFISFIISIVSIFSFYFNIYSPYIGFVADYNKKIEIWGEIIPGNNKNNKLSEMKINYNARLLGSSLRANKAITGIYRDEEITIDTFTYLYAIKPGIEKNTFEDKPYIIPYLVENGKGAVIIIAGGAYGRKTINGSNHEGKDIALSLNKAGINAFVLWYRSNPYEMPIPQLDLQRTIRYLKANADNFGFNKSQIALLGFSAGGYQVGSFINNIQGKNFFPKDYISDNIDMIDDSISLAAMIYPVLTYNYNVPMLFSSFNSTKVKDKISRKQLLKKTNLSENFSSQNIKQFIAYGLLDTMVPKEGTEEYIESAKNHNAEIEVVKVNQGHSFKQNFYMNKLISFINNNWN